MKFFKGNSFYILVVIYAILFLLAYTFDQGENFGRALAR